MTEQKYALNRSGPKRLKIIYPLAMTKAMIQFDGIDIGKIEGRDALKAGRDFTLPDGSILNVKLVSNIASSEIHVLCNGQPVPGSASDPQTVLANAYGALFFIAVVNIAVGLGTQVFHIAFLNSLSSGWFSVVFGILFGVLGFAVRNRSKPALGVALVIFVIDTGLLLLAMFSGNYSLGFGGMFIRVFLFIAMIRGFGAITKLDAAGSFGLDNKSQTDTWANVKKGLGVVAVLSVLFVISVGIPQLTSPKSTQPTKVLPTAAATAIPRLPEIVYFPDREPLVLNLKPRAPQVPVNLARDEDVAEKPLFAGDLAWDKPTYANMFYSNGNPSSSTSGGSGWRSADSNGSWLYVDLGEPKTFRQLIVNSFVDAKFTNSPRTFYIISDDLITWQIVVDEVNHANSTMRFKPRLLTLPRDVKARYVGVYAEEWRGGWGGVQSFSVIPSGYDYTQETLPEI